MLTLAFLTAVLTTIPVGPGEDVVTLECPPSIQTRQELASEHPGWRGAPSELPAKTGSPAHRGQPIGYTSGPAEQGAFLVPEADGWPIAEGDDVWLACRYTDTAILLSRPVPKGSTHCGFHEDPKTKKTTGWCIVDTRGR